MLFSPYEAVQIILRKTTVTEAPLSVEPQENLLLYFMEEKSPPLLEPLA